MRKLLFITVLVIVASSLFAQYNKRPLNSVQINLLGDASLISVNVEKQFIINSNLLLSGKLGLGYNREIIILCPGWMTGSLNCPKPENFLTFPHHLTLNAGKNRHFFEFGLGGTLISPNAKQLYFLYPIIGYRFLPLNSNRMNFRIFIQYPLSGEGLMGPVVLVEELTFTSFGLSFGISY